MLFRNVMLGAAMLVSMSSSAALIGTESGGVFEDKGLTTVDTQTGLEWLDVTQTIGLSFDEVQQDIVSNGGLFAKDEWRYATAREMETLGLNWFGVDISQIVFGYIPNNSDRMLEQFIATFGDTYQAFLGDIGFNGVVFDEFGGGFTQGFIDSTETFPDESVYTRSVAMFFDDEYTFVETGQRQDGPDVIAAQYGFLFADERYGDVGSFLVRDASNNAVFNEAVSVNAPATMGLMMLSSLGMLRLRRKNI